MHKSQSAMEYLMTYGWAILIIAVVLAVLFQLGVFSGGNFLPHAQPGSCQVSRTIAGTSLEGQCNGMLPEYAATFSQSPAGYITATDQQSSYQKLTVSFWIDPQNNGYWGNSGNYYEDAVALASSAGCGSATEFFYIEASINPPVESFSIGGARNFPGVHLTPNTWQTLVGVFDGSYLTVYLDGAQIGSPVLTNGNTVTSATNVMISGSNPIPSVAGCNPISGMLSNVQIYNTSLSSAEISALYLEGIGGAPIRPQNIVGWWPLNGNANDYSGNNNNGQLNSVTFSSSWESGYTAP